MSTTRIGLMGFGRIGRNVLRLVHEHPNLEVAVIDDIADPEGLAYLLKYDSIYGRFPGDVAHRDGNLIVNGATIPFVNGREPGDTKWSDFGVDVVVQATGKYRTRAWCERHLAAGAKKVILASTPETGDVPILLRGVNDEVLDGADMISLGSNTSNAIAPILKTLDAAFGLDRAFFTTVHALTNSQRLADVPSEGFRQSRAAGENIIPAATNSADILTEVMPEFAGKLSAVALNVPVADGSTVDLVAQVRKEATPADVNAAVEAACSSTYEGIVEYSADPIVSSDVRQSKYSAVYDSLATMVMTGTMLKTVTWFNNGWGYTARLLEVADTMAASLKEGASA